MGQISTSEKIVRFQAGGLIAYIDRQKGCLSQLALEHSGFTWAAWPGKTVVRDDVHGCFYGINEPAKVEVVVARNAVRIRKFFNNVPWVLEEKWTKDQDALGWEATLQMDSGDFRSCAIQLHLPWPQPLHPMKFWAAREGMPSAPNRYAQIALEYGEITSGILIPALVSYREKENVGLLAAMPFDFKTPRLRFVSTFRDPDLIIEFDWLALAPNRPAKAKLLFRATEGHWRPALGWLYNRYKDYFEPRSTTIQNLWGGHICGNFDADPEDIKIMRQLGLSWYEIHAHFPAYGNYHPESASTWHSGHSKDKKSISKELIKQTIKNLHEENVAALPYIQVTGDGDAEALPSGFTSSRIRDRHGEYVSAWPGTWLMNSDPKLPFGKDMQRQIRGIVERYPEMDGLFVDQACYNFLDTAHDDGLTAVGNRPAAMTGFNYAPHLEQLSKLLHPNKVMIANGPFCVGIMKYFDGLMAEGSEWLCDHLQYYTIGCKPMYFLLYRKEDRDLELMFQRCLIYGAGYSSYKQAAESADLYHQYVPLVERLFRRRWVFEADPLHLPTGYEGNVFRLQDDRLAVSMAGTMPRLARSGVKDSSLGLTFAEAATAKEAVLWLPGGEKRKVDFMTGNDGFECKLPADMLAGVLEISSR